MIKIYKSYYVIGLVITVPFVNLIYGYMYLKNYAELIFSNLIIANPLHAYLFIGGAFSFIVYPVYKKYLHALDKQILVSIASILSLNIVIQLLKIFNYTKFEYFASISIIYQIICIYYFALLVRVISKKIIEPLNIKLILIYFLVALLIIMSLMPIQKYEFGTIIIPILSFLYLGSVIKNFEVDIINVEAKISFEMKINKGPIFIVLLVGLIGFSRAIEHTYLLRILENYDIIYGIIIGIIITLSLLLIIAKFGENKIREWIFAFLISMTALSEFTIVISSDITTNLGFAFELSSLYTWMIFTPIIIASITKISRSPALTFISIMYIWEMNFAGFNLSYIFPIDLLIIGLMFPLIAIISILASIYSKYLRPPISIYSIIVYSISGEHILSIPKENHRDIWPIIKTTIDFFKDSEENVKDYGILFNNEYILSRQINGYIITIVADREDKSLKEYFTKFVDKVYEQYYENSTQLYSIVHTTFNWFFLAIMNV